MYITVRLLKGYSQPLLYKVPNQWASLPKKGDIVTVPIKQRETHAIILEAHTKLNEKPTFIIRQALAQQAFPQDPHWKGFITKVAAYYLSDPFFFYQRISSFITSKSILERSSPQAITKNKIIHKVILTQEQQKITNFLLPLIETPQYSPTLIHGVTGSGKTEIYKKIIEKTIQQNKSVFFMVPEVSLAMQFEHIFKTTLSESIHITGFHCATTPRQKKELWQRLLNKQPTVIIGVHLPVLLPVPNLGAIIIDEEHESGFIEKKHPRLHSKELAIWRAKLYNIPIILGSATPCLSSLAAVKTKNWNFFTLSKRFAGAFPIIKQAPLLSKKKRSSFWITEQLHEAIAQTLARNEQVILYLNRRGYCFFVICSECSYTFTCKSCSVSLTLHRSSSQDQDPSLLICHYCGYNKALPKCCPECKASQSKLGKKGVGTQQLISIIKKLFPSAHIARADLDTVKKKRLWQETVDQFSDGKIDILIGTQTITKGYHFPNVTLVGVIWADLHLNLPVYNAREQTLQKLIQVAGRAGRGHNESLVILQVMQDSDIFKFVDEKKYMEFFENEMSFRKLAKYPPFCRLIQIELRHKNTKSLTEETDSLSVYLRNLVTKKNLSIDILGPIKPIVHKIKNYDSRHIFLKAQHYQEAYLLLRTINRSSYNSDILITPSS